MDITSLLPTVVLPCLYAMQLSLTPAEQGIVDDLSWSTKSKVLNVRNTRNVDVQLRVDGRRDYGTPTPQYADDEIKLKLFRMMYESMSDSDSKIKRAELIRKAYENNTSFELGFIVADATDKFASMVDVSHMLERLFSEWKPIEHINAYEHIANRGIEISQLVELAKAVAKRDAHNHTAGYRRAFVNIRL